TAGREVLGVAGPALRDRDDMVKGRCLGRDAISAVPADPFVALEQLEPEVWIGEVVACLHARLRRRRHALLHRGYVQGQPHPVQGALTGGVADLDEAL